VLLSGVLRVCHNCDLSLIQLVICDARMRAIRVVKRTIPPLRSCVLLGGVSSSCLTADKCRNGKSSARVALFMATEIYGKSVN
jgi:hypothetical protein